jgi:AcrR family transcriptional regulator
MGKAMKTQGALKKDLSTELVRNGGTPQRILHSAIQLFADQGFDQVTVRDIAERAQVNHAAISYYFGTKEQLIKHAIATVIAPLNAQRLETLSAAWPSRSGKPKLEAVVRAMVEPTVAACMDGAGVQRHYARMLILAFALRQPFVEEVVSEQTDNVASQFVDAFAAALPGRDRADMYWGFDFMIGATLHILLDTSRNHRLRRISGGLCNTSSPKDVTEHLVRFVTAGIRASKIGAR